MSLRPYHVVWDWKAETSREYASNECCSIVGYCEPTWDINVDSLLASVRNAVIAASYNAVDQLRIELGIDFAITNIIPQIQWATRTERRQYRDYTCIRKYAKLKISCTVEFDSNVPVTTIEPIIELSPALAWWQWILAATYVLIFAVVVAKAFIESLLTKETTVSTTFAGHCNEDVSQWMVGQGLPACTVCQYVEFNVTEKRREPDWMSMLIIGGVVIVGVAVLAPIMAEIVRGR